MSKVLNLKEWLTLEDAAKFLCSISKEPITSTDLVQFAIDGHLKLSLFLTSPTLACTAEQIDIFPEDPFTPTVMRSYPEKGKDLLGLVDISDFCSNEFNLMVFKSLRTGELKVNGPILYVEQDSLIYELRKPSNGESTVESNSIPVGSELVIKTSELTKIQELIGESVEIHGRERNNLLMCIASLMWRIEIDPEKRGAAGQLTQVMARAGYGPISEATALKWVKDINKFRPKRRQ